MPSGKCRWEEVLDKCRAEIKVEEDKKEALEKSKRQRTRDDDDKDVVDDDDDDDNDTTNSSSSFRQRKRKKKIKWTRPPILLSDASQRNLYVTQLKMVEKVVQVMKTSGLDIIDPKQWQSPAHQKAAREVLEVDRGCTKDSLQQAFNTKMQWLSMRLAHEKLCHPANHQASLLLKPAHQLLITLYKL